jgi:hypothetical protein
LPIKRGDWGDVPNEFGQDTLKLIELYTETGKTVEEIAHDLNRSECSIAKKLSRLRKLFKKKGQILERKSPADFYIPSKKNSKIPDPSRHGIEREEKENTMVIQSHSGRIKTLEHLIEAAEIDLDVWIIERHIINKWEVAGKFGVKGDEYFEVENLWQVKVWLVRKDPIQISPVISPISIKIVGKLPKPKQVDPKGMKRGLTLPDPQFGFKKSLRTAKLEPFHDRTALDVALQIAQDYELEYVCWLGDFFDLADWSDKFSRDPNFYWTTQPAAIEGKWWLAQFRMADPEARIKLLEGNHEARMPKQLIEHMKEAFGLRSVDALNLPPLMSIPRILALHELDIEWIGDYPNGESWVNDYVVCEHGSIARNKSGATVSAMVQSVNETRIIGHIHRIESATRTIHEKKGTRIVSVQSVGCLCRIDGIVPGAGKSNKANWQQAIGMIEYFTDGRPEHIVIPIPINNGRAVYNGKVYEARDRLDEIRESTRKHYEDGIGWNF